MIELKKENGMLRSRIAGLEELLRVHEQVSIEQARKLEGALENLRTSESNFRQTLDNMMEGCQIIGFDWRYRYVNESAAKYGRQEKEDLIGRTVMEMFPGFEDTEVYSVLRDCMESRTARHRELEFTFPNGENGWFVFSIQPVPEGIFILSLDITEQKRSEERIRKLNRVYAVLSEINQAIVRIRDLIELFNESCEIAVEKGNFPLAWIGLVDESTQKLQVIASAGRDEGRYLDEIISLVNSSSPPPCAIRKALAQGEHAVCSIVGCIGKGLEHCSKSVNELGFRALASFPLKISGKVKGLIVFHACEHDFFDEEEIRLLDELAMDISFAMEFSERESQRRHAEESLRFRNAILSTQQDSSIDGILVVDDNAMIVSYNRRFIEMWGVPQEFVDRKDDGPVLQHMARQLADPESFLQRVQYFYEHRQETGRDELCLEDERIFDRYSAPMFGPDGRYYGRVWYFRDITGQRRQEEEREKLKDQLVQSQKMEAVGQLAGGVAHDFNNMLQVILGYANMAAAETPVEGNVSKYLLEIRKATHRSADLTRQLLAFARKQTIVPRVIDLNETVSGILKMLGRLIGENIGLVWKPGDNLHQVKMDPTQLDQILANITVNARDAICGSGKIIIETKNSDIDDTFRRIHPDSVPGRYVQLSFSDTGCGMDRETQTRIFEPFFTTKPEGKGTGLGLAMVYGIVMQNEGFINVYSEPGQGTTFKLYFPADMSGERKKGDDIETEDHWIAGGSETLLIVEDEAAILTLTGRILKQLGYTVITASTPQEAVRLSNTHVGDIHLLITDVVMPEMNGRELWTRIREKRPDVRCLYMSGYTSNVIAHHGVLDKDVNFLEKPFSAANLVAKIREALWK